jgi:hypothetical protein
MEDERREISATQWVRIYKRFSSTDSRWSPDTLQLSAEENWTAKTILSVYLFLIIKVDFRTINCYMQIRAKIAFAQYKQREGYEISLETTEF